MSKINELKGLELNDLRATYRFFLKTKGLSKNTISTASTDTFYLWRKGSPELFWKVVTSDTFEVEAKATLIQALQKNSSGNAFLLANGYVSHLRRFRDFVFSEEKLFRERTASVPIKDGGRRIVPVPSFEQVEYYLKKWNHLENYQLQEAALDKLFLELCPENKCIEDILLKASVLNDFYSTNIFSIYPVAKHILELEIDGRLHKGDPSLVMDIQQVEISGKVKHFYFFATKYCSHHNSLDFPIFDYYVEKVLKHFQKEDRFMKTNGVELTDYRNFKNILTEFQRYYGLEQFTLKDIDKYLWQLGKEFFPRKY